MNRGQRAESAPNRKAAYVIAGTLVCAAFCVIPAPAALGQAAALAGSDGAAAMRILGITGLAILWWLGQVLQDWLVAIVMMLLWVVLGGLPFQTAFLGYTNTSAWLVAGAFCLSATVSKTGLFQRISLFLIRLFSPTFRGQVLALLLSGALCAPLLPSTTAKAVLGVTIAHNIADAMGYPPNSRSRCGLFLAAFIGFASTSPAFMSAGISAYLVIGYMPPEAQARMSWLAWFHYTFIWILVLLVGAFLMLQLFFAPESGGSVQSSYIRQEDEKLGKMRRPEQIAMVLLASAFLLWFLGAYLHINAAVAALGIAVLCFASGILENSDLGTAVPWGLFIFLGCVLNIGNIFAEAGIDRWLQELLSALFLHNSSPALFIVSIALFVIIFRLFLLSQTATISLMLAVLSPVAVSFGISPFIVGFVTLSVQGSWFLFYQNTVFKAALSCAKGTVAHRQTVLACAAFEAISIAGSLASIPLWRSLGLL